MYLSSGDIISFTIPSLIDNFQKLRVQTVIVGMKESSQKNENAIK
jgi:hypothetical protein